MNSRYPRFERRSPGGIHVLRDGLVLRFFMQHDHKEIGGAVSRALECYRQGVGPEKLGLYTSDEGYIMPIEAWASNHIQDKLLHAEGCVLELWEHDDQLGGYRVEYRGRSLGSVWYTREPDAVSSASFWLPTEHLEEQGPARVKELAVALSRELPFNTGYASLAFNGLMDMRMVHSMIQELSPLYPGLDVVDVEQTTSLGTKPKGAYWLNFYGQPLLGALGGAEGLREQLILPEITVQELAPDKVLVELGEWPEAQSAPAAYQRLAQLLEPHR